MSAYDDSSRRRSGNANADAQGGGAGTTAVDSQIKVYLSIIIPAYNEENRLPATLQRILEYMALRDFSYEIVVVDDGSRDGTCDYVQGLAEKHETVRLVRNGMNRGKGYSVRHGVLESRGRDILFSDADLSTPIEECERLLPCISSGEFDIAIGSRAMAESRLEIRQPWYRERMGRVFNWLVRKVTGLGDIPDTQCGFKCFRGEAARYLFGKQRIEGFAFDAEILYLAKKFGYRIKQVPIRWLNSADSRVHVVKHSIQMLKDLIKMRLADRRGVYGD
jgi:dolichyl-phosphate beta-glucosyltransferase